MSSMTVLRSTPSYASMCLARTTDAFVELVHPVLGSLAWDIERQPKNPGTGT